MTDEQTSPPVVPTFTEAPASWNVRYLIEGFECQLTLRSMSSADLIPTTKVAIAWLKEHGAQPTGKNNAPSLPAPAHAGALPPPAGAGAPPPAAQAEPEYEVIKVESISHHISKNGKDFLLVKGGRFSKFGVNAWPEAVPSEAEGWTGWPVEAEYQPLDGMKYAVVRDKKVSLFRPTPN